MKFETQQQRKAEEYKENERDRFNLQAAFMYCVQTYIPNEIRKGFKTLVSFHTTILFYVSIAPQRQKSARQVGTIRNSSNERTRLQSKPLNINVETGNKENCIILPISLGR